MSIGKLNFFDAFFLFEKLIKIEEKITYSFGKFAVSQGRLEMLS